MVKQYTEGSFFVEWALLFFYIYLSVFISWNDTSIHEMKLYPSLELSTAKYGAQLTSHVFHL